MRKGIVGIVIMMLLIVGSGCGTEANESVETNSGKLSKENAILPDEVEILDTDGTISRENAEVTTLFDERMFWGKWILEGSLYDTSRSTGTDKSITLRRGELTSDVECLPTVIVFGADANTDALGTLADGYQDAMTIDEYGFVRVLYNQPDEMKSKAELENVFSEENGYAVNGIDPWGETGRWYRAAFSIADNTMALGVLDIGINEEIHAGDRASVQEIDYGFSWSGSKMTLEYNGETATYVPERYEKEENQVVLLNGENIRGLNEEEQFIRLQFRNMEGIAEKKYFPVADIEVRINEDDSLALVEDGGFEHSFDQYYYAGDTLTLVKDGDYQVFDGDDTLEWNSGIDVAFYDGLSYYMEDGYIETMVGESVGDLMEIGFTGSTNLTMDIPGGTVTDLFSLDYKGAKYYVKAVNTYENPLPLNECVICYQCIDDTSGSVAAGNGDQVFPVGMVTFLDIKDCLKALTPLSIDSRQIVYSTPLIVSVITSPIEWDYKEQRERKGEEIITDNHERRMKFTFQDDILTSVVEEAPSLLYYGLEDNVDMDVLEGMTAAEAAKAMDERDDVLANLQEAFQGASVPVDINSDTGVITMSNDILYGVGEYELSNEGKVYIDEFMTAFGSAVLSEDVRDKIQRIEILGHTDQTGSYESNLELSQKRAEIVLDYFMESPNVGLNAAQKKSFAEIAETIGKSYSDPIFSKSGSIDMDASRRVEIKFYINNQY